MAASMVVKMAVWKVAWSAANWVSKKAGPSAEQMAARTVGQRAAYSAASSVVTLVMRKAER